GCCEGSGGVLRPAVCRVDLRPTPGAALRNPLSFMVREPTAGAAFFSQFRADPNVRHRVPGHRYAHWNSIYHMLLAHVQLTTISSLESVRNTHILIGPRLRVQTLCTNRNWVACIVYLLVVDAGAE